MEQTSTSEKLHTFIEASKAKGAADDFLVNLLREQGWAAKDIYAALGRYYQSLTGLPVPVRAGGAGEAARDAFLYLLAFSTLATWTIALGSLMFTYIDRWFRTRWCGNQLRLLLRSLVRWLVSSWVFPFFSWSCASS